MNEKMKESRNKYMREWRKKHPEKVKEYQDKYWAKKAAQAAEVENAEKSD